MGEGHTSSSRVSVYVAAEVLGVTVDAIRKRIQRGTIPHERDEDGRVWVLLDESSKVQDADEDTYRPRPDADALISQMRDEISYLREENRRKDHLLAAALERIPPALEPPSDERESPESAAEPGIREEPFDREPGPEDTARPRSWWREFFGFGS